MTTLISAEFRKLRTIRTPWVILAVQQVIIIAGIAGLVVSGDDLGAPTSTRSVLAHAGVPALLTLVLGITAVAGEYRHRTITDAYLGTPRRDRVVAAKLVAYAVVGAAFGVVNAASALAAGAVAMSVEDTALDLASADVWRTLAGGVGWNVLYAAIGVSLGALVRNLMVAVTIALSWIAVAETIVGQLVGDLARWLPNRSAAALAYLPNPDLLPQWGAGLVLAGYAAVLAALAAATTVRRDVT